MATNKTDIYPSIVKKIAKNLQTRHIRMGGDNNGY